MPRIDPHSYSDPTQGSIKHVDFFMDLDFEDRKIRGRANYKLARAASGKLDLDSRSLNIVTVSAGDTAIPFEVAATETFMGEKLTLDLPEGTESFAIEFETSPEASALQWLEPSNTAGGKLPFLFSQCQPIHARAIFPCQDSPSVRFSYTARVAVPSGLTPVMSAAPPVKENSLDDGRDLYSFDMPQPIPSYLFAIAVGNLVQEDLGPRSRVYAEPETLKAAVYEFGEVDAMLVAAEEIFGPYLWERFDFVVMPPAFPYGGMENPRLTFLTPTLLAGDRSLTNVLAHELAHSWTGNLVTNATMNDFWLNEGFTVWAERRILEKLDGEKALTLSAALGRAGLNEAVEQFGVDSPLTRLETDLAGTDPDEVYSLVPYEKGFLFVALMEQTLGREDMDAFVHQYIERFSFRSITTADFEGFVEEVRPGLMEKMSADKWIHGEGIPDSAPVFESPRLGELTALAQGWADDVRPTDGQLRAWTATELQVFMQNLPKMMDEDQCENLRYVLNMDSCKNAELLCAWMVIAATSGYKPAIGRMDNFLGEVGRMKFLKPIYSALAKGEGTLELARDIYRKHSSKYHPIARGGLEKILEL